MDQITGVREFLSNGTFTAPPGTTHLLVEMWGGGGGGAIGPLPAGGGGGGGAYSRSVIAVTPGVKYNVVVGGGGAVFPPGPSGGDSKIVDPSGKILIFAGGGRDGTLLPVGGAGGTADAGAMINHPGNPGQSSFLGGAGYVGNSNPPVGFSGAGGNAGSPGYSGYVLLEW